MGRYDIEMKIRLLVFDLDNTLCPGGMPIETENVKRLKELEESGLRIAICSGKSLFYLTGFMRQVGLKHPFLVGENGITAQEGVGLPPRHYQMADISAEVLRRLQKIKGRIRQEYPDMWFQPNEVVVTPFAKSAEQDVRIGEILSEMDLTGLDVYHHSDCYDIVPSGVSKRTGVEILCRMLDITPQEVAAAGDGENDYPMFEYVGLPIGVNVKRQELVKKNFSSTEDMLKWMIETMIIKNHDMKK